MKTFWQNKKSDIYIELYDDFAAHLKTKDEIEFFKKFFTKNQRIIEFGCGTGRTLIPLLEAGYKVEGLDISSGMLKHLKQKLDKKSLKTRVHNEDLVRFSLKDKFDGGILSQRTLNFIADQDDQKKALMNINKCLKKGAFLVINLMPARKDDFKSIQKKLKKNGEFKNSKTGNKVEFWGSWIPDSVKQTWDFVDEFREKNNRASTKMKMRVIFEIEMENLLKKCGFETVNIYGGWDKDKYDAKSKDLIFVAKKA